MKLVLALVTTAVAAGAFTPVADAAGTYDVWGCRLPDHGPAPIAGWQPIGLDAPPPSNQCSPTGGMRAEFQVDAIAAGGHVGWRFDAPPNTRIAGYELYRSARAGMGADGTIRSYALYHDTPRFDPMVSMFEYCTPAPQRCTTVGDPDAPYPMDPDDRVARSGLSFSRLILRMECGPPGDARGCGPADPPGSFTIGRSRITLSDPAPPTLAPPAGPLVAAGAVLDGPQAVSVSARDVGGGVERFAVLIDGDLAAHEPLHDTHPACFKPFVQLVPCPATISRSFAFDTRAVPNGPHTIQIAALDAAGNRALSTAVPVHVANGSIPNGVGAARRARLVAGFQARGRRIGRRRATVPFGATRRIRGRLTDTRGRPIRQARIEVVATNSRTGARTRREAVVQTDARGRFGYVPWRGPSRRLRFRYRAFSLDPEPSATADVVLSVRAGLRLDVRPRRTTQRGTIRFAGRLRGGPGRAGLQVALYAVGRRGRARVPVALLKTDATGRFRYRYRFVRTFAPFTYRFQAVVERQRDYPYAAAASRRVAVRIVR